LLHHWVVHSLLLVLLLLLHARCCLRDEGQVVC
jgi:hypothetical protein